MRQGLAVFNFDLNATDENKLTYRGTLTNLDGEIETNVSNDYYYDYLSFIERGIQIGDYLYTVSDKYIASYDLATLTPIERESLHS
jgi:Beta propeller domain.